MKDDDRWLERWLPLLRERARDGAVLELGCGDGRDSMFLADAGFNVIGIDRSAAQIERAKRAVPSAGFHCADFREPLPFLAKDFGAIVASLALHYFEWDETEQLLERIRNLLRSRGVLLCRVNSTNDHHHGASGHPALAENYYAVDGERKRFFDRAALDRLFARGWTTLSIEERSIDRYAQTKVIWEIVLERQ